VVLLLLVGFAGVAVTGLVAGFAGVVGAASASPVAECGTVSAEPTTASGGELSFTLSPEQQQMAEVIGQQAQALKVPERGVVVGYMVALQESTLRNLPGGDADSIGLFQQRPSQGWGTPEQLRDPAYQATGFFKRLLGTAGWEGMALGDAAQAVQRSGNPGAYAHWQPDAEVLTAQVPGSFLSGSGACGVMPDCPKVTQTQEQHLTPDALAVLRCGLQQFPAVKFTAGWTPGVGHGTDSLHYSGRAIDFMLPYPVGSKEAVALGDAIADWAYSQRDTFGVTEIIWNARIRTKARGWEWRTYHGGCPGGKCDPTLQHLDHVHVSVAGASGTYGSVEVSGDVTLPIPAGHYTLTARFGQCGGRWAHCHTGLDFAAPTGTPIHAVASGVVRNAGLNIYGGAYGNLTDVEAGSGVHFWYAHQSRIIVKPGDVVKVGQVIGYVGATGNVSGPHVHLEVRKGGSPGTPVDPYRWLWQKGLRP
jgi:hypothetical protein